MENSIVRAKEVSADLATLEHFGIITVAQVEAVVIRMVACLDTMREAHRTKDKVTFVTMRERLWTLAGNVRKAVETFEVASVEAILQDSTFSTTDNARARKLLRDQEAKSKAQQLDVIQQLCALTKQVGRHTCANCDVVQVCPLPDGVAYRSRTMS